MGHSCPLGEQFVLIVFCLFVIFIYFPFWFEERDLPFDCSSSCSLLFYYFFPRVNSSRYGLMSFRSEALRIWNSLPNNLRGVRPAVPMTLNQTGKVSHLQLFYCLKFNCDKVHKSLVTSVEIQLHARAVVQSRLPESKRPWIED